MSERIALVTGGSRGLGKNAVQQLRAQRVFQCLDLSRYAPLRQA